jgi:hypothetical protein
LVPPGVTIPLSVAVVDSIADAAVVCAPADAGVVKLSTFAGVGGVEAALLAFNWKKYVVPAVRPVSEKLAGTGLVPEPTLVVVVECATVGFAVSHTKLYDVGMPLGFTVPFSVADVGATDVAGSVTASGGLFVVKVESAPFTML